MPKFRPNLSEHDYQQLDNYRLQRLRSLLNFPKNFGLRLDTDRALLICCPPDSAETGLKKRLQLRQLGWIVAGANWLYIYSGDQLIYSSPTMPRLITLHTEPTIGSTLRESYSVGVSSSMATATATQAAPARRQGRGSSKSSKSSRSSQPKQTASQPTQSAIPTVARLKNLAMVADKTGVDASQIAGEIAAQGGLVFFDEDTSSYKSAETAISNWVDSWLDRDRAQRRSELLGGIQTTTPAAESNGKVAPPEPTARKERKSSGLPRILPFDKGRSYANTIDNFLIAQKFTDIQRVEAIEAMVQGSEQGQRYIKAILKKHPGNRETLLKKLSEMTGSPATAEESVATPEGED